MKFSLRFNNDLPVSQYVTLARVAEAAGFDQFWVSHDLFLRSAPVILTAIAAATERIEIGTGIVNPYTINPAEIAMLAATLDEASNGRFNLGIGAGASEFLKWIDIHPTKPLTAVRESILAIRRLLAGERAEFSGEFLQWDEEAYLRFEPPRRHIPIYVGAMSPHMLRLIGEVADGGLPLLFPPEHYSTVLPYIQAGAERAGRSLAEIDIAACIWCAIGGEADVDALRDKIAYYGHALSPLIWDELGVTKEAFAPIEQAIMVERDVEKARRLVTPEMLRIGITGSTDDLIVRMEHLVDLGVRHLSFGPPLGADPLAAISAIGRDVIPHFRDRGN
ncbi:MAG TPA: LLM class flavin-dependent oxidoreductase [Phototrophicaceae bacterium]|nr:LLM class flavin-dependent oxidoreductase [Phototrophicaceae bacterium]